MKLDYHQLGIRTSSPLILGVSGGPDSICLLHLLHESGFKKIIVAHLDHKIRKDSWRDAKLTKNAAEKYGYFFELKTVPVKKIAAESKENIEAVGREERYRFFRELRKKYRAKYILTAHHADDQIETVLINIIRGSGLEGLCGMKVVEGDLWRPLLSSPKQELEAYCKNKKLKYVRESTNQDIEYRRNFLRLKVIPLIKKLNPRFLATMENNLRIWNSTAEYFDRAAESIIKDLQLKAHRYDLRKFLNLDEVLQGFVIRFIFEKVHGHKKDLQQSHLEQILKVLRTNISGKKKEFGAGKILVRQKTFFEVM